MVNETKEFYKNDKGYLKHIVISQTNFDQIMKGQVREIFIRNNPSREGCKVSSNEIMNSLIRTYIVVNSL